MLEKLWTLRRPPQMWLEDSYDGSWIGANSIRALLQYGILKMNKDRRRETPTAQTFLNRFHFYNMEHITVSKADVQDAMLPVKS